MSYNCPICNKAGLPDYTITHMVCPQCNSDLKPFLLLNSLTKGTSNKRFFFWFIGAALIALVFVGLYFNSNSRNKMFVRSNSNIIIRLQDTIYNLQTTIENLQKAESQSSGKPIVIKYKVKKNDFLSKIAQFFFNDWRLYKKIEADNELHQPYVLKAGQILNIKLIQ